MGFCTQDEYSEFLRQVPEFERNLARSDIHLIKFWFSVSRKEQRRRFKNREVHPLKQWKLLPTDMASLDKLDAYTQAKEAMFFLYRYRRCALDCGEVGLQKTGTAQLNAIHFAQITVSQ